MKFITGEDLELWYRDKIKGTVRPEIGVMKRYKKHFTKFITKGDFDELEVKDFYEEDLQKYQATELVIKNKKFIDNSHRQMYQKGSFEDIPKQ